MTKSTCVTSRFTCYTCVLEHVVTFFAGGYGGVLKIFLNAEKQNPTYAIKDLCQDAARIARGMFFSVVLNDSEWSRVV